MSENITIIRNECLSNYQNLVNVDFTNENSFENAFLLQNIIFPPNVKMIFGFNYCTSLVSLNFSNCLDKSPLDKALAVSVFLSDFFDRRSEIVSKAVERLFRDDSNFLSIS